MHILIDSHDGLAEAAQTGVESEEMKRARGEAARAGHSHNGNCETANISFWAGLQAKNAGRLAVVVRASCVYSVRMLNLFVQCERGPHA